MLKLLSIIFALAICRLRTAFALNKPKICTKPFYFVVATVNIVRLWIVNYKFKMQNC